VKSYGNLEHILAVLMFKVMQCPEFHYTDGTPGAHTFHMLRYYCPELVYVVAQGVMISHLLSC